MGKLATAACLADKFGFLFHLCADSFAIGHLRLANVGSDTELTPHAVDNDIQVQFTHTRNNNLATFGICFHPERRVFLRQLGQRHPHFLLISNRAGFYRNGDHRFRKFHSFKRNRLVLRAQGLACGHIFQTNGGSNIPSTHFFNFAAVVGVHLHHSANPLFFAFNRVEHLVTGFKHTGIDAEKCQRTHKRVRCDFKGKRSKRRIIISLTRIHGPVSKDAFDGFDLGRRRQIINDRIQHGLHAFVLEC